MADAVVGLGLNPAGMTAGSRVAVSELATVAAAARNVPAGMTPIRGALDGMAARYRVLARVADTSFREQAASAQRTSRVIGQTGARAGEAFGATFAAGLRRSGGRATAALFSSLQKLDQLLPHSDASRGPLSNLTRSGQAIPETVARGVQRGTPALMAAVDRAAQQVHKRLAGIKPPPIQLPAVTPAPMVGGARAMMMSPMVAGPQMPIAGQMLRRQSAANLAAAREQAPMRAPQAQPPPTQPQPMMPVHDVGARLQRQSAANLAESRAARERTLGLTPETPVRPAMRRRRGAEFAGSRGRWMAWWGAERQRAMQGGAGAPPTGGTGRRPAATDDGGAGMASSGLGRLWALSALGGQVRSAVYGVQRMVDTSVERASDVQVAAAELRTVLPDEADQRRVRRRAVLSARGGTEAGRIAGVGERQYLEAAFASVASGFTAEEAVQSVEQSVILARAGQTTPQEAQIAIGQLYKTYGEATADIPRLADLMAKTQDLFAFPRGMGEMVAAMTKAAPVMASRGIAEEEMAISVGVLADAGFRGAVGGTAARMVAQRLPDASERLGFQIARDAEGGIQLEETLRNIQAGGFTPEQMRRGFGTRTEPYAQVLIGGLDKFERGLGDYAGTALENAAEHAETYATRTAKFDAQLGLLQRNMGEGAIKARTLALAVGTGLVSSLNALGPGMAEMIGGFGQVAGVIGQAAVGGLDIAVGLHAMSQLSGNQRGFRGMFDGIRRGTRRGSRGIRGMFGLLTRGMGVAGRGFGALLARVGAQAAGTAVGSATGAAVGGAASRAVGGTVAGTVGGAVAAKGAGAAALAGGAVTSGVAAAGLGVGVGLASAIAIRQRKSEAEQAARTQAQVEGLSPVETEQRVEQARASERVLSRFGRAREEGAGLLSATWQGLGFGRRGDAIGTTLAAGMEGSGEALGAAADTMLQPVAQRLPQSDAELGPLSTLTASGRAIPMTLAVGALEGEPVLRDAITGIFSRLGLQLPTVADTGGGQVLPAQAPPLPAVLQTAAPPGAEPAAGGVAPLVDVAVAPDQQAPVVQLGAPQPVEPAVNVQAPGVEPAAAPPVTVAQSLPVTEQPEVVLRPEATEGATVPGSVPAFEPDPLEAPVVDASPLATLRDDDEEGSLPVLTAALQAATATQQRLVEATMGLLREQRRGRRSRGQQPRDATTGRDVMDYDMEADILRATTA